MSLCSLFQPIGLVSAYHAFHHLAMKSRTAIPRYDAQASPVMANSGYTNPARWRFEWVTRSPSARAAWRYLRFFPRASAEMLLGIGAAPRWSNLRLKIPEKFLECSGEFSTTPLVATKLQKYIPLIVVELGP